MPPFQTNRQPAFRQPAFSPTIKQPSDEIESMSVKEMVEKLRQIEVKLADIQDDAIDLEEVMETMYDTNPEFRSMGLLNSMTKTAASIKYAKRSASLVAKQLGDSDR